MDQRGVYLIQGRLDPEVGAVLMRAIEAASDALYKVAEEEPLGPEPPKADQRRIPPAIRRALWLPDGGCRFPGCGLRFTQGHDLRHWALGGKTCMDNLVSLCRTHHRAVHEDGFRVKARGGGKFKFYSPEGWPLGDTPPRMDVELGDPAVELIRENRRRGVSPRWDDPNAQYASEVYIPDRLLFRAWEASEEG